MKKVFLVALLSLLLSCSDSPVSSPEPPSEPDHIVEADEMVDHISHVGEMVDPCQKYMQAWESLRGTPYVWGGQTGAGVDCSGSIWLVFKLAGTPIPRTTSARYWLMFSGDAVHWQDAACGHIVWFTLSPGRPFGHLGQSFKPEGFWHSGSSTGVTQAEFKVGMYWDRVFVGSKPFD